MPRPAALTGTWRIRSTRPLPACQDCPLLPHCPMRHYLAPCIAGNLARDHEARGIPTDYTDPEAPR